MNRILLLMVAWVLAAWPASVPAHEVRPAYLELRESAPDKFDVTWKVPAKGDYRLALYVRLPRECRGDPGVGFFVDAAHVERRRITCAGGLAGRSVSIDGLSVTHTDVLVRIRRLNGAEQTSRLSPDHPTLQIPATQSIWGIASTYLAMGVEHILGGIDHLLFVLVLLFLVRSSRSLFATITAFTIAHSITLAAATLGWIQVPQAPVEATIALSIMLVAAEALRRAREPAEPNAHAPWMAAFVFGLLHGFGFAGALRDAGLPDYNIPVALLLFNIGVEIGQILFVSAVILLLKALACSPFRLPDSHRALAVQQSVTYVVGCLSAFWVVQRLAAFWG